MENNDGALCCQKFDIIGQKAECLSHFSDEKSAQKLIIVDVHGSIEINDIIVNACILTLKLAFGRRGFQEQKRSRTLKKKYTRIFTKRFRKLYSYMHIH